MMPYNMDDILRLRFMGTVNGEPFQLVQHFRARTVIDNVQEFQNHLTINFLWEFRALMTATTRFTHVGHARVLPSDGDEEDELPIVPVVGARQVQSMPNQIATLVKVRTLLDAPAGRGRLYLPGVPQDSFVDGGWSHGALTAMTSVAGFLMLRVGPGGTNTYLEWGVASYQTDPLSWNRVAAVEFGNYPATMRTRRPTLT